MKKLPYIVGSAVGLFVLLAPVRAEETAPAPAPAPKSSTENNLALGATLLADLLKQASAATPEKDASAAAAAPADAQTQELQALLISVMKSISQMLPQFLAALDANQSGSGGGDSFSAKVDDFLGTAAAPIKKAREVGLHSAGLKTSGLNPDGSASATNDEDWKRQFQRREPNR